MRPTPALRLAVLCSLAFATLAAGAEVNFQIRDQKSAALADAVISLLPLDRTTPLPANVGPSTPVEIEQKGQEFSPFVTVVRTGTAVRLPNRDTVEHYVYSKSEPKRFQLPLYAPGKAETETFDQPGVIVLGCNIHDWMLAYVVAVDTPWFGRTDARGQLLIPAVPAGRYRAEVWHPRLAKTETRELVIDANPAPPVEFTLTLKPDRRVRRGTDSGRGGYR